MRYVIKQKIFSLGDNFKIKDEFENDRFIVKGKVIALGDKLKLEDLNGNELYYIEQKLFKLLPEYNIYKQGTQVARVKKEFTFFKPKFMIESSFGSYTMQGDFLAYDFDIMKDGITIASISKKFFALSDTYSVDIPDNEDQAFILSLVIVIDQVLHDSEHSSH